VICWHKKATVKTGVELANSYSSLDDARILAAKIGITLPTDDDAAELCLIKSGQYLNRYEKPMEASGCSKRTTTIQGLFFPRTGACLRCVEIGENEIPNDLKIAQLVVANDFASGGAAWGSKDEGRSIASHEVTGAVAQSYFDTGKTSDDYTIPRADTIMSAFCGSGSRDKFIFTSRLFNAN